MKKPQQVTTKEPQQVTTKDPKKVEVGRYLAAHNHKKRELKAQSNVQIAELGTASGGVNQYYGIGGGGGRSDRHSWLLHLLNQERNCNCRLPSRVQGPAG